MDVGLRQHPATHLLWLEKFVTRAGLEVRDSQLSVLSESQRTLCVKSHWGRDNNIGQQQNWSNTHRRRQDQGHLGIQNRKRRWLLLISKAKDANSVVTPLCLAELDTSQPVWKNPWLWEEMQHEKRQRCWSQAPQLDRWIASFPQTRHSFWFFPFLGLDTEANVVKQAAWIPNWSVAVVN